MYKQRMCYFQGEYRMDKDTLGETRVPADKYYGSETARSINNFPSGGENERMPFPLISAIGIIKKAAAIANKDFGLDSQIADAIVKASEEVMCGELYCQHFPLGIWQAGAATNSHINANEVIANRAIEIMGGEIGSKCPVHPNDHVNMGQSTNDVIPSAIHIALALELHNNTLPGIKCLAEELEKKSKEWDKITKVGRTHLMDAVPIKLGQEFCGYYCQICDGLERIEATLPGLYELQMGGTAVGTELNAACGFGEKVASLISQYTGKILDISSWL
ncbi:hypothetical protein ANN_03355 [Periplaneta americana]|uniref:fumarate hydratase n=1 Tax=Periplaneta americana TaxID=6978 RepID=A0ABQ8U2A5_PERAM|nr:hypothetical protein ANN_03355 [Periplaneta americana]